MIPSTSGSKTRIAGGTSCRHKRIQLRITVALLVFVLVFVVDVASSFLGGTKQTFHHSQKAFTFVLPTILNMAPNEESPSSSSSKRQKLVSALSASTSSSTDNDMTQATTKSTITPQELEELASEMKERATSGTPFTESEISDLIRSIKHVLSSDEELDFEALTTLVKEVGHLSHKDWIKTMEYSSRLETILFPTSSSETQQNNIDDSSKGILFRGIFERVLRDGKWDGARRYSDKEKPWAVVVTGLNGIRKTTTIYQDFYQTLLNEALVCPSDETSPPSADLLPVGSNSFFRQLDHMIAVLANVQFMILYSIDVGDKINDNVIKAYSKYKDAIFARYRTLSEMVGIILCRQAQAARINVMVETSGRDISMYKYINQVFPEGYNKLALHFTINDIEYAKQSVDSRMVDEIQRGKAALIAGEGESTSDIVKRVVDVNAGGPYGSEVLEGVQKDATRVWNEVWEDSDHENKEVSDGWHKACFHIEGFTDKPWTVTSVLQDGTSKGSTFEFPLRK